MTSTPVERHTARTNHVCTWCGEAINAGESYHRYRWFGSDGPVQVKMHPECLDAMRDEARAEGGPIEWMPGECDRPAKQEQSA